MSRERWLSSWRVLSTVLAVCLVAAVSAVASPHPMAAAQSVPPYSSPPQGSWVNAYGSQGYVLGAWDGSSASAAASDLVVLPSGVTFTLDQGARWCWSCPTGDVRGLQTPDATSRRGATWYHTSQLRMHLSFSAPYSGPLRLYALDWEGAGRRQRVTVNDGSGNQTIDVTTSITQGAWLVFPINITAPGGGTVNITADRTAGNTAAISGVFLGNGAPFTPPPPPPPPYSSPPQGSWVNAYGSQGYVLGAWDGSSASAAASDLVVLPSGVTFTLDQGARWCWSCPTGDVRGLQTPDATSRRGATWYHTSQLRMHLSFSAPYSGPLRLYALDWEGAGRRQRVTVNDGSGNQTIDVTTSITQGAWLVFPINITAPGGGTVNITADRTAGNTAAISGVFLGNGAPFTPPPPPPPPYSSPPQGSWVNAYGSQGYVLGAWDGSSASAAASDLVVLPSGVTFTLDQGARWCWSCPTGDVRGLQTPDATSRRGATWYHTSQLRMHLSFSAPYSGPLRLYALDWEGAGRRQRVTVNDGSGNQTIDVTTSITQGAWLVFPINITAPGGGTVNITADRTAGNTAAISGVFLGNGAPFTPPPPPPPPYSSPPQGSWVNAYGSQGYVLGAWDGSSASAAASDLVVLPSGVTFTLDQGARWCWSCPTGDVRGLQTPDATSRRGATWYHTSQLRMHLSFSAPYSGPLRLYALDWEGAGRRQRVTVNDGSGNQTIDVTTSITQGAWLVFPINITAPGGGTVNITADRTAGNTAAISGVFLGNGAPFTPPPPGPAPGGAEPGQVLSDYDADPTATNWVVADAPDPFVLRVDPSFCAPDGGSPSVCYYAYTTNVLFNPIPVWRSTDLTHWYMAGIDDPDPTAPADSDTFPNGSAVDDSQFANWSQEVFDKWAPAVVQAGGQYVIWYSARNGHGPHCLGVATASSPDGPFRDVANAPRVCRDSQGGVIDASPFTDTDGQRYLTFKTEGTPSQPSRIYVAPLGTDGITLGSQTLLLERQGGWELPRIEGPTLWRSSAGLFLFYSAGDWESSGYAVGVARCSTPLGPCTRVYTTPVLASRGAALGPGGQTPLVDAAGQLQLAFHAWSAPKVGYANGGARSMRFLTATFPGGNPKIG